MIYLAVCDLPNVHAAEVDILRNLIDLPSLVDFLKGIAHVLHGRSGGECGTGLDVHRLGCMAGEIVQLLTVGEGEIVGERVGGRRREEGVGWMCTGKKERNGGERRRNKIYKVLIKIQVLRHLSALSTCRA